MYPPIHEKPAQITSFDRLDLLWDRYPRYHEKTTFATLDDLLEEHASYQKDFEDLRKEYVEMDMTVFWCSCPGRTLPTGRRRKK